MSDAFDNADIEKRSGAYAIQKEFHLLEDTLYLVRISYLNRKDIKKFQQSFLVLSNHTSKITLRAWKCSLCSFSFPQVLNRIFGKETDWNSFLQMCLFFSKVDTEVLYTFALILVTDVDTNRITIENVTELLRLFHFDDITSVLLTLFQVYDSNHKGYWTLQEYLQYCSENATFLQPITYFRDVFLNTVYSRNDWKVIRTRAQMVPTIETYRKNHNGKFPKTSFIEYCKIIFGGESHPYKYDFEPLTNDISKENQIAVVSFMSRYNSSITKCLNKSAYSERNMKSMDVDDVMMITRMNSNAEGVSHSTSVDVFGQKIKKSESY